MDTLERLKELLKQLSPDFNFDELKRENTLRNDLGLDSLTITILSILVEDEFNIPAVNDIHLTTVGDLCDYIDDVRCMM